MGHDWMFQFGGFGVFFPLIYSNKKPLQDFMALKKLQRLEGEK